MAETEWLTVPVIRRRLWQLAKGYRTNMETELEVRALIPNLIAAHVSNWYGGTPRTNSKGAPIIEWPEQLNFVCGLRPDVWPGAAPDDDKNTVPKGKQPGARKRGTKPLTIDRITKAMKAHIESGRYTVAQWERFTDQQLQEIYGAGRNTVRDARLVVLSDLGTN
jgi:hypothetical protein